MLRQSMVEQRSTWSPSSWQQKSVAQQVVYPDMAALGRVLTQISRLPPLVTSWEAEKLKGQLAAATRGERFLLQGGDCAEDPEDCTDSVIVKRLKILLQMSLLLAYGCRKGVIHVGRFAGQYAKPRSSDSETRDGVTLPSYRGWSINRPGFSMAERTPDPALLLRGYKRAALTLNFVRALVEGGFADLHHPEYWDLDFFGDSPQAREYRRMAASLADSVRFMEALAGTTIDQLNHVKFFISHEALHLPYEQAQTRQVPRLHRWYDLTTHFPWIGDRTRAPDGAHVEYCRGIANPIGLKVGPTLDADGLLELIEILNPENEPGRLTLIHRFGAERIDTCLPPLVEAVKKAGKVVLWCCDPMHGNTHVTQTGVKTRGFDDIVRELEKSFMIHNQLGSMLGGVHLELTGESVTECIGGARQLSDADLVRAYKSHVDPRLNYEQALEVAMLIARHMRRNHKPVSPP